MRFSLVPLVFMSLLGVITYFSLNISTSQSKSELARKKVSQKPKSWMMQASFYRSGSSAQNIQLKADRVEIEQKGEAQIFSFKNPRGKDREKKLTISYRAREGELNQGRGMLYLRGDVNISTALHQYKSDYASLDNKNQKLEAGGNVELKAKTQLGERIKIKANSMDVDLTRKQVFFEGAVHGDIKQSGKYQEKLYFQSNQLELQEEDFLINLMDQVQFRLGGLTAKSRKASLYLDSARKKLKYFEMNDDIRIREKIVRPNGESYERRASAQKLEGSRDKRTLVLSGSPSVSQEKNIIKGYRITLKRDSEVVEVEESRSSLDLRK